MSKSEQHMIAIEPASMTVPTMDRPSIAFAWFLDNVTVSVTMTGDPDDTTGYTEWMCNVCGRAIMDVDDGQSLRVILNTALAHGC